MTVADLPPRYRPADWESQAADDATAATPEPVSEAAAATDTATSLSERAALFLLENPVAASGTFLPPEGLDLREHMSRHRGERSSARRWTVRSGMVAQAARLLGLRRTTLVEKLRKFDIGIADDSSED